MATVGPYCLVVSSGVLQNSSDVFTILDPDTGGASTFSVKLSANGLLPATHWAAYTYLESDVYNALTNMTTTQFKAFVDAKAAEYGRTPVGSVTAFKNNVQIGGKGDPWAFIAGLGLLIVIEPFSAA
jgi:hypothetical protein